MWRALKKTILSLKQVAGLEIILLPNNEFLLILVYLKLKNGAVQKEFEHSHLSTFEQVKEMLPANTPIALVVNGKGVLQKKIDSKSLTDKNFDIQKFLPNLNPNDFIQEVDQYSSFSVVSVIRKDLLENIINKIKEQDLKILSVNLGFKTISCLFPLMKNNKTVIFETAVTNITVINDEIADYQQIDPLLISAKTKTEYNLGNQYIKSTGLIAFGAALTLLISNFEESVGCSIQTVKSDKDEYKNYMFFKAAIWGVLFLLFTSLLINFLLYNNYYTKNKELVNYKKNSIEQIDKNKELENEIVLKESFIQTSGWLNSSRLSFFADRIAAAVPDEIFLTSINIHPINSGLISNNSELNFKKDTIQISGTCEDPLQLNSFVTKLKSISEIKLVSVKTYSNKRENESGSFSLELLTK